MSRTSVQIILDRSISMSSSTGQTISGFNEFVEAQKLENPEARIGLTLFSTPEDVEVRYTNLPISQVPKLDTWNYRAAGASTALLDAVGKTLERLDAEFSANPPDKVVLVIITDGHENSSYRYKLEQIASEIRNRQDDWRRWTVVFLGADIDAFGAARTLGVYQGNTLSYASRDTSKSWDKLSRATVAYASSNLVGSTSYFSDPGASLADDPDAQ